MHRLDHEGGPPQLAQVGGRTVVAEDQREVGLVGAHRGQGLGRLGLPHRHLDAGMRGGEPGQGTGRDGGSGGGEGDQPDPAGAQLRPGVDLLLREPQLARHGVGASEQGDTGLRRGDTPWTTDEQWAARLALEALQLLAHRRLRPPQLARRRAQRARAHDVAEEQHPARVHPHDPSLPYGWTNQLGDSLE